MGSLLYSKTVTVSRVGGDDKLRLVECFDTKGNLLTFYMLKPSKALKSYVTAGNTYTVQYKESAVPLYAGEIISAKELK